MLVARDSEGELLKIPIPLHYLYVFIAGALIGMLTITGMAGSYTRMLMKVARFNQLRTEKEALKHRYTTLEKVAHERDLQVASLGSLASEVSALYGLKTATPFIARANDATVRSSIDQLAALKSTAMSGAASIGINYGLRRGATTADWLRLAAAPSLWPVQGYVTSSFGQRIDPFNGEGAFHTGIDIHADFGTPVVAPADGSVTMVGLLGGYGRCIEIDHGHGITTLYGHLSGFAVSEGQVVRRGQVIGYVGSSGRATAAHLHYEVRIGNTPVNPYKYLRAAPTPILVASGD
jgi:murein DD-endopeptidase MepM/ murein hydrolase activator NlpD